MDELKGKKVIAQKRGYEPDYVNLFVKHHKTRCVGLLDSAVFVTRSMLGLINGVGETEDVRGGEGKEGGKGGDKSTYAGLE